MLRFLHYCSLITGFSALTRSVSQFWYVARSLNISYQLFYTLIISLSWYVLIISNIWTLRCSRKETNRSELCKRRETWKTSVMGFMGTVSRSFFDVTSLNRTLTEQALVLFRDCYGTQKCRETCSLLIKLSADCNNLPWEVTAANSYSVALLLL